MSHAKAVEAARLDVPNPRDAPGGGDEFAAVRTEGGMEDGLLLAQRLAEEVSGFHIPYAGGVIPGCGDGQFAVGAESAETDVALVAPGQAYQTTTGCTPEPGGVILRSSEQKAAVRTERYEI